MGGCKALLCHLLAGFVGHCGIALNNPCGDLFIAVPAGVLHKIPTVLFGLLCGITNGVVVARFQDLRLGLGVHIPDGLCAKLRRANGHVDVSFTAQLSSCPRHAAAMIAIGGRDKNHLLDGVCIFRLFQVGKADGIHVQPQLAADHAGQCVQTTKPLERIQTEPLGFVLDENCLDAQSLRHGIQPDQRCTLVTRQLLMDAVRGRCRLFRQKVRPFPQRLGFVLYD